ncbi:cortical protein marker for cell polarity-domain-containing protein [Umbelopsis sp. AD052]|nr:cortical protein marker for cell polarity-domain-containing protein [Umbelopsis sp. AD052]
MALAHLSLAVHLILLISLPSYALYQPLPEFDLSGFQQVVVTGQYSGLSFATDTNQFHQADHGAILSLNTNSTFDILSTINGNITSTCILPTTNGSFDLYIAGNFSMIGSASTMNIAKYQYESNTTISLDQGLNGPVNTLLCDSTTNAVYVGGHFTAPINVMNNSAQLAEFGGNLAIWQNNTWSAVPWKGVNGPVNAIVRTQYGSIVFGGQFDSTTDGIFDYVPTSQPVSLTLPAVISGGNSADTVGYNDPSSIVCSNGTQTPWLLQDNRSGYWQASFPHAVTPSLFRLTNANYQGRGTQNFSILALGTNQHFNLSYIDPNTSQLRFCSVNCTLPIGGTSSHDFQVVSPILASGVQISVNSWYGVGGGLSGVAIFQSEIIVHADNDMNVSNCTSITANAQNYGSSAVTGNWTSSLAQGSYQWVLTNSFPTANFTKSSGAIDYKPNLPETGNYSVYVFTPGCVGNSDCSRRTKAQYITHVSPTLSVNATVDQRNATDGYTLIYRGWVPATSDLFQPHVSMALAKNATKPTGKTANLVAGYVQFVKEISNQELNSVLEYHVDQWLQNTSSAAWWPLKNDSLPRNSIVTTLEASTLDLIIGGNFNTSNYTNIVQYSYSASKLIPFSFAGLDGPVNTMLINGSHLYIGGNFSLPTNASQPALNNLAMYDLAAGTWNAMENGVNGPVTSFATYTSPNSTSNSLVISGPFTSINALNASSGTALYDITQRAFVSTQQPFLSGTVISTYDVANNTILIGNIQAAESYQVNALSVIGNQYQFNPIPLFPTDVSYHTNAGMFWTNPSTGNSTMIVGGQFQLPNNVQNIAMLVNESWTGFPMTNWQGQVTTLTIAENNLVIAGDFTAITDGQNLTSLAVWNLLNHTHLPVQDLQNDDGSHPIVNIVRKKPDGSGVIVGGKFSHAGSLPCSSLCLLDINNLQWSNIAGNITGEITDFDFVSNQLLVAGDLVVNGVQAYLALVNTDLTSTPIGYTNRTSLPGPSSSVFYDSTNGKAFIAGRSASNSYISQWSGDDMTSLLTTDLGNNSHISQIFMVPSTQKSDVLSKGGLIMVTGQLDINGYGDASAALFDGTQFHPYLTTAALNGSTGSIRSMFFGSCCPDIGEKNYLPVPIVILISIAIALGLVFFVVLGALLIMYLKRRKEVNTLPKGAPEAYIGKPPRRPQSLLAMLMPAAGAALMGERSSMSEHQPRPDSEISQHRAFSTGNRLGGEVVEMGSGSAVATGGAGHHLRSRRSLSERLTPDLIIPPEPVYFPMPSRDSAASDVPNNRSSFAAAVQIAARNNAENLPPSEERPHLYFAKFEFKAREHGELGFSAGDRIIVVDANDDVWWMGYKDNGFGEPKQGVFPSNYVEKAPAAVNSNNPYRNSLNST